MTRRSAYQGTIHRKLLKYPTSCYFLSRISMFRTWQFASKCDGLQLPDYSRAVRFCATAAVSSSSCRQQRRSGLSLLSISGACHSVSILKNPTLDSGMPQVMMFVRCTHGAAAARVFRRTWQERCALPKPCLLCLSLRHCLNCERGSS